MKNKIISEKVSRNLLLSNLKQENVESNVYLTFKYISNKDKLKPELERIY